jgi:polyhydroxyalkanoate synthesis regulator phasin
MGAIKDIVDLATQLSESVQNRKFSADLMEIIRLINTIQGDQVRLTEDNLQLMSNKVALERTISSFESDIARLQDEVSKLKNGQPKSDVKITEETFNILNTLFNHHVGCSIEDCSKTFNLSMSETKYHFDILLKSDLIYKSAYATRGTQPSYMDEFHTYPKRQHRPASPDLYSLTPDGRALVVEKKHNRDRELLR